MAFPTLPPGSVEPPGAPGIEPRWTSSDKSAVGTSVSSASSVWFTASHGILNEIYYPRVDYACTRDFGFIVTNGRDYFSEEKRHASSTVHPVDDGVPAFRLANVAADRYRALRLSQRAGDAKPPALRVFDLRGQRLEHGLARTTFDAIAATLARDEQVLVFKNRRGYAPVVMCHDCGWSATCDQCERALTLHRASRRLRCHHCGASRPVPRACPSCEGLAVHPLGQGTERIEEALHERFPGTPIVRVDRDTTRGRRARSSCRRGSLDRALSRPLARRQPDHRSNRDRRAVPSAKVGPSADVSRAVR